MKEILNSSLKWERGQHNQLPEVEIKRRLSAIGFTNFIKLCLLSYSLLYKLQLLRFIQYCPQASKPHYNLG